MNEKSEQLRKQLESLRRDSETLRSDCLELIDRTQALVKQIEERGLPTNAA